MPAPAIPDTQADRDAWAALWTAILAPWRRAVDLADQLGVHRSLLSHYASDNRQAPRATLRGALRATARRHPEAVPAVAQTLIRELMDVDGHWVPEVDPADLGDAEREVGDVLVAAGALLSAIRSGAADGEIDRLGGHLIRQAHEAARARRA